MLHCKGDQATPFALGREVAAGIAGAKFVQLEGDKRPLVSRMDLRRHAKNWKALVSHVHHAVEPYYVIVAVGSFIVGAVGFVVSRLR